MTGTASIRQLADKVRCELSMPDGKKWNFNCRDLEGKRFNMADGEQEPMQMPDKSGLAHLQRLAGGTGHYVATPDGRSHPIDGDEIREYARKNLGMKESDEVTTASALSQQEKIQKMAAGDPGLVLADMRSCINERRRIGGTPKSAACQLRERLEAGMEATGMNERQAQVFLASHDPVYQRLWEEKRGEEIQKQRIHKASVLAERRRGSVNF